MLVPTLGWISQCMRVATLVWFTLPKPDTKMMLMLAANVVSAVKIDCNCSGNIVTRLAKLATYLFLYLFMPEHQQWVTCLNCFMVDFANKILFASR